MSSYTRLASGSASSMALEQSNADLTLLSQSLNKSKRITDKMTSMLSDFDDRLAKLEKSLVPIYKQTGRLTRVSKNLEATLRSIDGLLGHHDLVERESPLIAKGPDPSNLKPYMEALDRLASAMEALRKTDAKGQALTLSQMSALLDTGSRHLVQVFIQWAKDTSATVDAGSLFDKGKPFPPLSAFFLDNALPLIAFLKGLSGIGPKLYKDLELAYADVRSSYMEACLKPCAKEVLIDAVPSLVASSERRSLARLLDVLFALAKSEYALVGTIFPGVSSRRDIYAATLPLSLALFFSTGQGLNSLVKQALSSLVSIAFASFSELQDRIHEFEEWIRTKAGRKDNELGDLVHAFRGTCLTSLPEFLDDCKVWGTKAPSSAESTATGVNAMTLNVTTYMRQLSETQETVESFLKVLGPGNWGGPPNRTPITSDDGEEPTLLTRYLNDVLTVLLTALDSRGRNLRGRPGLSAIFLLNNVSYIRREVLGSQTGDQLGEACEDTLNKKMRSAKVAYLDIWSPLVSTLLDAGIDSSGAAGAIKAGIGAVKGGGDKRETKDRFVRFFNEFEEIESLHQVARLDEGEVELRERLKGEVARMLIPSYTKFFERHRNGDFSKNASKYLRMDADELSRVIAALFE